MSHDPTWPEPFALIAPTSEQCEACADLEVLGEQTAFAAWHPQWGGYVGKCVVFFHPLSEGADDTGCFDVHCWHDGEFPNEEEPPDTRHYCAAEHLVDFGLLVLEKKKASTGAGLPFPAEREWVEASISRLRALLEET